MTTPVLIAVLVMAVAPAVAADTTAPVHLNPHAGEVTTTDSVSGTANVHMKFLSVDQACLAFEFADNALDSGDELSITVDGSDAGGFFDSGSEPQAERTFCWTVGHSTVADFLDGKAKLEFKAVSGRHSRSETLLSIAG